MLTVIRWLLVPVVPIVALIALAAVASLLGLVFGHSDLFRSVPEDWRAGCGYALGAVLWVWAGSAMAPKAHLPVAVVLFLIGACLANLALASWTTQDYQPSDVPLYLTLGGGLLGVFLSWRWGKWRQQCGRRRMGQCVKCGQQLLPSTIVCPECGVVRPA